MPEQAILEAKGLVRRFGGLLAVDKIDLSVEPGSVHGLIGPNGAGKTTLLNLIAGAMRPTAGSMSFEGRDATSWKSPRRAEEGIARTFQNVRLFLDMSVLENVMVGAHTRGKAGIFAPILRLAHQVAEERRLREIAMEMLDFVEILPLASTPASALPYGHRRLVEIARALASQPRLLLLDEPAAGITRGEARNLVGLIQRIQVRGVTMVLVEHHMDVVFRSCTRLTVLHHGRKLAEGSPGEVRRRPEVIEAYFGSAEPTDATAAPTEGADA